MRKFFKFIFVTLSILIVLFIAAAIAIPVLYKEKILAEVKMEMNEHLDAKTDFKDITISLFHHFPHLSVRIHDLCITGKEAFRHDTLISAEQIDLSLDIQKAVNGVYDILKVDLVKPRIMAVVLANGSANWNIMKPTAPETPTTSKPHHFSVKLRHYSITHGYIDYVDKQNKIAMVIEDLVHEGGGNFTDNDFILKTKTAAKTINVIYGKIPYLTNIKTNFNFDIKIDNKTNKYSFDTKDIQLNGLNVSARGFIQLKDSLNTVVDMEFSTPSNDFKDFLSLVPGIYEEHFKDVKTAGKASIAGKIKGVYNRHEVPTFNVNVDVENGSFQYPDLPKKIENIQIKLTASNPDGVPDHTVIDLQKGHLDFGPEPFDFHVLVKEPLSSQWIDAYIKGKLDLSQLKEFVKLDESTKLAGIINANVSVRGSVAEIEKKRDLDSVYANGMITVDNLNYSSKDFPEVASLSSMMLMFDPQNITLSNLKGQYLSTQFSGEGNIKNLLGYYLHNGVLSGSIHITADRIDGNKWKHTFTHPKAKPMMPQSPEEPFVAPSKMNISLNAEVTEIEYDHVKIKNVQGAMILGDEVIHVQDVQAHALEGEVKINGHYSTQISKKNPDLDFEYVVSLGRLVIMRKHINHM